MRRMLVVLVTAAATVIALAGCGGGGNPLKGGGGGGGGSSTTITVGSANFPENSLLAEIYAQALEAKGVKVNRKFNIGTREAYIPALKDGSIDLLPEYTGNLLSFLKKGKVPGNNLTADKVYTDTQAALPSNLELLDKASAEDKDAITVTQATASKYNLKSIADLKSHASSLTIGGPPEFEKRFAGLVGLKQLYGLKFKQFKKLDTAGPITVKALKDGNVDAADLFTTDPAVAANNFVALQDPKQLFLAQNVTPLINKKKANSKVSGALNAISAKLTTDQLKDLVKQVVTDKKDPATVAKTWLSQNGLAQ
jgi:osmoprotectant transport system substrate-binding protein